MKILAVIGPWQLVILLAIVILIIIVIVSIFRSRTKHKEPAKILDDALKNEKETDDKIEKLERLNSLRNSGTLTEEEFDEERKRIME